MGAANGNISFQSMDVSAATGAISVGGRTNDHSFKGTPTSSSYFPFLVFYEPDILSRKWEKYADIGDASVQTVGFSPDGNYLFAFFQIACHSSTPISLCRNIIMLFQSSDGKVLYQSIFN